MKKEVKVLELTKEDLVTFFSAATYGCGYWTIKIKKNSISIYDLDTNQCIEEIWADALLKGGKLVVTDNEDESKYVVDMEKVLKGYTKCYEVSPQTMVNFEEENEDMWDGYNLMQVILFGEIIYG
jgi:hypothetical protein